MKNKHLPTLGTLICILALLGCSKPDVKWIGEPAPDERAKMGLKGPVVKVTSSYFNAKDTTATLDSLLLTMPATVFENIFASSGQGIESKHWTRGT
ncbi:MAG TPA: hypothetical protein VHS96_13950, partial [Bacteroidia bacterium]|nr:hypothetical protein [Bacteroidia bacterium]